MTDLGETAAKDPRACGSFSLSSMDGEQDGPSEFSSQLIAIAIRKTRHVDCVLMILPLIGP
jgi:hypothetical protein